MPFSLTTSSSSSSSSRSGGSATSATSTSAAMLSLSPKLLIPVLAVGTAGLAWVAQRVAQWRRARQRTERRRAEYDLVIDITVSPDQKPWRITSPLDRPYERVVDALVICILGDFKVGKTFLLNQLCGLHLPSTEVDHTLGLSLKRLDAPRQHLLWIDTQGRDSPYDVHREALEARMSLENLVNDLAYQLSDVQIVVTSHCKMRDQEFIYSIHKSMLAVNRPGKALLIVVHNYSRIAVASDLERAFQNDVVQRFHVQRVGIPDRRNPPRLNFVWIDRSTDSFPTYHFVLGKEGSAAGAQYNPATYDGLWALVSSRIGFHRARLDVLESLVYLLNSTLLQRHLGSDTNTLQVQLNASASAIEPILPTATTMMMMTTTNGNLLSGLGYRGGGGGGGGGGGYGMLGVDDPTTSNGVGVVDYLPPTSLTPVGSAILLHHPPCSASSSSSSSSGGGTSTSTATSLTMTSDDYDHTTGMPLRRKPTY